MELLKRAISSRLISFQRFQMFWLIVLGLISGFVWDIAVPLAHADEICYYTCSDGNRSAGSSVPSDDACFSACQSGCAGHGGCYDYAYAGTTAPDIAGDSCAHAAATTSTGSTRRAALSALARLASSPTTKTSTMTCQVLSSIDSSRCVSGGCGSTAATFCCTPGSEAANNCAAAAITASCASETEVARKETVPGSAPRDQWTIQRVCDFQAALDKCVQRANAGTCSSDAQVRCCPPNTGIALSSQCPQSAASRNSSQFQLQIVCNDLAHGNCTLDNIIQTGVNFANLLLALSGSIYLVIFIYAAVLYLTAAGSDRVGKAKKMLTGATIGMVCMLGAYTIIRYVRQGITSSGTEADTCTTGAANSRGTLYSCLNVAGMSSDDKTSYDCPDSDHEAQALCPGTDTNFRCCLITPTAPPEGGGATGGAGTGAPSCPLPPGCVAGTPEYDQLTTCISTSPTVAGCQRCLSLTTCPAAH